MTRSSSPEARAELKSMAGIPEGMLASLTHLTYFEDMSLPRPIGDEVVFRPSGDQSLLLPSPVYEYKDRRTLIPYELWTGLLFFLPVPLWGHFRKRRHLRSAPDKPWPSDGDRASAALPVLRSETHSSAGVHFDPAATMNAGHHREV